MNRLTHLSATTAVALVLVTALAGSAAADVDRGVDATGELVADAAPDGAAVHVPQRAAAGFVAATSAGRVAIPSRPADTITVSPNAGGAHVTVTLPREATVGTGRSAQDGTVVYPAADGATDVAAQALEQGGVRLLTVTRDAGGPTSFTYDFGPGVVPVLEADGSVVLTAPAGPDGLDGLTVEIARIAAPWAVDADGDPVATRYRVDGTSVVQTVAHDAPGTAYPVVADPTISVGAGVYWHFNRAETRTWASYGVTGMGVAGGACAAVGRLGGPIVAVAVGGACAYIAARMIHAATVANNSSPRRCFYVRMIPGLGLAFITAGTYAGSRCR